MTEMSASAADTGPALGEHRPLCFIHLAKTGGTSLTDAISRLYSPGRVLMNGGYLSVDFLASLGDRLTGPVFLAGHPGPGVAAFLQPRADLITVLRQPVEQAVSHYLHVLSDPDHPLHREAAGRSFTDYLRGNPDLIDLQARWLSVAIGSDRAGAGPSQRCDTARLLRFIDEAPFVGVIEHAELCGEVLSRLLPAGGPVTLSHLNAAVSRGVSTRTLGRLRLEYEDLRGDARLAPAFALEALVHARAAARLAVLARDVTGKSPMAPVTRTSWFVDAARFFTGSGRPADGVITADLAEPGAHIVHGPYDRLPRGCHAAAFEFDIRDAHPPLKSRIQLEVLANGRVCLRRRWLGPGTWTSHGARTLHFANLDPSDVLEFRIRARGFQRGRLLFGGVAVRPSTLSRAWPSHVSRAISMLRRAASRRGEPPTHRRAHEVLEP